MADVLEAAIRVLKTEGIRRFTMARIAEKAGVSVGSLYQYFPNKEAILFDLQAREWEETAALLSGVLADRSIPPDVRVRRVIGLFFQSEREEAALRTALAEAAPLYRDTPEAKGLRARIEGILVSFMAEILPAHSEGQRAFATDMVKTTIGALGKQFSEGDRSPEEIDALAKATADMVIGWIKGYRAKTETIRPGCPFSRA
ncbi:TetR family transcriptional regulator [Rhodospirillum sp. A1_3_36]|uniref:TetR family transcriptional regulator n=1 Tax=Rhodospirillum sp. A1_3_36 TaxID=3391666 RepID=UPI0039A5154D